MTLHETAHPAHAPGIDSTWTFETTARSLTGRRPVAGGVIDAIGDTPLIELSRFGAARGARARILGKAAFSNPLGRVKDRIAWGIIRAAEESVMLRVGALRRCARGSMLVPEDSEMLLLVAMMACVTRENTGIASPAIAAGRGYRTKFHLRDNTSPDNRLLLEPIGAEIVPVPNSLFLD